MENIADNGGFKLAYLAYKKWLDKGIPERNLDSFKDFTFTQMFWISLANMWCAAYVDEELEIEQLSSDSHTHAKYRVNGALSNMNQFSKDWSCSKGMPMNPEKKCKVW